MFSLKASFQEAPRATLDPDGNVEGDRLCKFYIILNCTETIVVVLLILLFLLTNCKQWLRERMEGIRKRSPRVD